MELARKLFLTVVVTLLALAPVVASAEGDVKLPAPVYKGTVSVEQAIVKRSSQRMFQAAPLTLQQVSQLLWATNGVLPMDAISGPTRKSTPSAGGLYPLEVVVVTGKDTVENLPAGVYVYDPFGNRLKTLVDEDRRSQLASAAPGNSFLARAPVIVVIAGVFGRTTGKYQQRGVNYVFIEAGNANQNLCLQAVALSLKSATVGAFNDAQVAAVLKLPKDVVPLLILPVGK